jgi:CTP synthase (UTP-ammonia lyase)
LRLRTDIGIRHAGTGICRVGQAEGVKYGSPVGARLQGSMKKTIALLGEYDPSFPPHTATTAAIAHARAMLDADIDARWISTENIDGSLFEDSSALWIAPGSPYKNINKTLLAIKDARERGVPCFGTCGGFQHMVLEYARNSLGFKDAKHAEYDPYASELFISELACSLAGREMDLSFVAGSKVAEIYGCLRATEQYYCNFGVNPDKVALLKSGPMRFTGADNEGELRVIELPGHPFFLGALFVPQMRSTRENPHPLVTAFVEAALRAA